MILKWTYFSFVKCRFYFHWLGLETLSHLSSISTNKYSHIIVHVHIIKVYKLKKVSICTLWYVKWLFSANYLQLPVRVVYYSLNGKAKYIYDNIHCFIFIFIGETTIKFSVPVARTGHFQTGSITLHNDTSDWKLKKRDQDCAKLGVAIPARPLILYLVLYLTTAWKLPDKLFPKLTTKLSPKLLPKFRYAR